VVGVEALRKREEVAVPLYKVPNHRTLVVVVVEQHKAVLE